MDPVRRIMSSLSNFLGLCTMASNPQKLDALTHTKKYLTKSNPYGLEIQNFKKLLLNTFCL